MKGKDNVMTKQTQREMCLVRRRALSEWERAAQSAAICEYLAALPALQEARTVLSYRATADEADLTAFHAWARERDVALAFPVCLGRGEMEAYIPRTPEDWRQGRYGIWEPDPERAEPVQPETLDAVILPCVGFDGQGGRLGHGGGCYDRYLPRCPKAERILVAFSCQEVDQVATDSHDQPFHRAVTEKGTFSVAGALDSPGPGTIYY